MTKAEAAVIRAALRCCRAKKKYDETQDVRDQHWLHGTLEELISVMESAAKEFKEWVVLKQEPNISEPSMRCDACGAEEKVKFPLAMNEIGNIINGFRSKHMDCGPAGD